MIEIKNRCDCSGCSACAQLCPTGCIQMQPDIEGFLYPSADKDRCIGCNLCDTWCQARQRLDGAINTEAYGAKASPEYRERSSSGGIFPLLANWILDRDGVVYGAVIDSSGTVHHSRGETWEEIQPMRSSKYVQSSIGITYNQVKEDLDNGRWVLFTGTPCQVDGLRNYLRGKPYDRLLCQDLVCHGVPSPKVWQKYIDEKGFHKDLQITFRDKSTGWATYSLTMTQKKRRYKKLFSKDSYGRAFLTDIMLRPSCYNCRYKKMQYAGDITLADFWGIDTVLPDFADDQGVSLVFLHTQKGRQVFADIRDHIEAQQVSLEDAQKGNQSGIFGTSPHRSREDFMTGLASHSFEAMVTKYVKDALWVRGKRYLKRKMSR